MSDLIVLGSAFKTAGWVSAIVCFFALSCSAAHTVFFFFERNRQKDEFMRGLACRMKALFLTITLLLGIIFISGVGLMVNFTIKTWLYIVIARTIACLVLVGALFWLYSFYRRPNA